MRQSQPGRGERPLQGDDGVGVDEADPLADEPVFQGRRALLQALELRQEPLGAPVRGRDPPGQRQDVDGDRQRLDLAAQRPLLGQHHQRLDLIPVERREEAHQHPLAAHQRGVREIGDPHGAAVYLHGSTAGDILPPA